MTMKPESVDTAIDTAQTMSGSRHDLWIGGDGGEVLTITIDKYSKAFPPDVKQCQLLNDMIQGLARATRSVVYHASNETSVDTEFVTQPIEDIVDATMILSQLSAAICAEAHA
jgi:hypothetical protein